jgi:4-hydroxy-3-methylbut-2-enyl diphosphate reductase
MIHGPKTDDICYATTNRQQAVKAIAPGADLVIVLGSANSSNARRLVEVALAHGARAAVLLASGSELDERLLAGVRRLGITAGASTPEELVEGLLDSLRRRFAVEIEEISVIAETTHFRLPRALGA